MLTRTTHWKQLLAEAVRDPAELAALLGLPADTLGLEAVRAFPLRVPRGYIARMHPGDPNDPLLRQVLPLAVELNPVAGFTPDPVGDRAASRGHGLLHKYHGRVLLVATGACAIHCRYCFRRHYPYGDDNAAGGQWAEVLRLIAADESISEVILSGGDPLVLEDHKLALLAEPLAAIPHVRRLRIHTRLPIVLPERIDADLLAWFTGGRLQPVMVVHANHPQELSAEVSAALGRLRRAGVTLLNQAVLLRGVNDEAGTLALLSESLFESGVLPYYLHLLDRVAGAAHFEVDEVAASALMDRLRRRLPGYLVPQLVRESPGEPFKLPLLR